ncbi:MAG: hypothetical protein HOV86_19025, partial [Thermoactinospora sp.]|nr:hypothetical protein [Thermoactinospora sp.]
MSIDREALVRRHTVIDAGCPLTVGNGEFAFTADATGLQTFAPLGTQAQWGWHTMPNPKDHVLDDALTDYDGVGYPDLYPATEAGGWLHVNPHRLHLGRIGLDAAPGAVIGRSKQTLDLWTGLLSSSFELDGVPYEVETVCHPERDLLAVRVAGGGGIRITFPYASDGWHTTADWGRPDRHTTTHALNGSRCDFIRVLDADHYYVAAEWTGQARFTAPGPHEYVIQGDQLELVVEFCRRPPGPLPSFPRVRTAAAAHWQRFWTSGGAVSFEGSADPRAPEL